jgi:hypothetical protein
MNAMTEAMSAVIAKGSAVGMHFGQGFTDLGLLGLFWILE